MKYVLCQNNNSSSKYFNGKICYEEILVDNDSKTGLCWKCTAVMVPAPEQKKPSGYPRGWKFMNEFVDKDGNVYHKGELQQELFGTLPPTKIEKKSKSPKKKKVKQTLDDKIMDEFSKRTSKSAKKSTRKK